MDLEQARRLLEQKKVQPPPTGNLPTFFHGSSFDPELSKIPDGPPVNPNRHHPVPQPGEAEKVIFNGVTDTGRELSGTQAFLSRGKEK